MRHCLVPPKITPIPSRSRVLHWKRRWEKTRQENGPENFHFCGKQNTCQEQDSLCPSQSQPALWEWSSHTEKGRSDLTGLSRKKQPKTCRIFPKALQLSSVFSLQMLLCRAPETQGSFQVSASVERVKLGVLVEFHSVSQQTPKQGDIYLPVMLGQGEAVMRHGGESWCCWSQKNSQQWWGIWHSGSWTKLSLKTQPRVARILGSLQQESSQTNKPIHPSTTPTSSRATSTPFVNISNAGDATTALGILLQSFRALSIEKFPLTANPNLPWLNSRPFHLGKLCPIPWDFKKWWGQADERRLGWNLAFPRSWHSKCPLLCPLVPRVMDGCCLSPTLDWSLEL